MPRRWRVVLTVLVCLAPVPAGASGRWSPDASRAGQVVSGSDLPAAAIEQTGEPAAMSRVQAPVNDRVTASAAF